LKPKGRKKKMNTYIRKLKKNSKALSPVVASIILIAVTVAVSVVVAAWMGGMTIGLMGNAEQASIANVAFPSGTKIDVLVQNSGSTTVNITQAYINGFSATMNSTSPSVGKSASTTIQLTLPNSDTLSAGTSYQIKLITAKGTQITNSAVYNP
jgi:archaeal type IV pilus assembly protein PilA